jgi:hypothetical protein
MRAHAVFSDYQQFLTPLNRRVVRGSLGVIVHNAYAASNLEGLNGDIPVEVIPHHLSPRAYEVDGMDKIECRRGLGIPDDACVVASFFISLKAYTEDGRPGWKDPSDIHNQMYQFDVVTIL